MQIKLNNNIMNLIGLNAYLVLFCIYLTKLKKNTLNIVILFLFGLLNSLLKQENSCFYNSSNYYQLVSFLNTKNNIVVVVLLLYIMFLNSLKTKKNITCTITMFVLYDYNYFDNTNNLFMSFWEKAENQININLINGVMLIHPVLLYFYYGLIFLFVTLLKNNLILLKKNHNNENKKNTHLNKTNLFIITSILLGCWWAEQELSWGGWWSWDFVELLALNYLILILMHTHTKSSLSLFSTLNKFIKIFFLVVMFIFFVRFNLINSIHNFVSAETTNQYYIYIISFVVFVYFIQAKVIPISMFRKKINNNTVVIYNYSLFIFLFLIYLLVDILSNLFFNLNLNIKDFYLVIIFILFTFFLSKNNQLNQINTVNVLLVTTVAMLYGIPYYIDIIFALFLYKYLFLIQNNTFKKKNYHLLLVFLFFSSFCQTFLFFSEKSQIYINNIYLIKKSTNIFNNIIFSKNCSIGTYLEGTKVNITYLKKTLRNNDSLVDDIHKVIFEKKIFFERNSIIELYNYNYQIFFCLNLAVLFFLFLFLKKKKVFL